MCYLEESPGISCSSQDQGKMPKAGGIFSVIGRGNDLEGDLRGVGDMGC